MDAPMIWVISPDPDTRQLIGLNLSKRGFRHLEISSQDDLATAGAAPQLIVLDESGWQVASALRQNPEVRGVPIIWSLSVAPPARWLAALQPVHWLEKPLAIDALLVLVRQSLGQGER